MWVAFVFGDPANAIYFIEGDDYKDAQRILWNTFGKMGISNLHQSEYLTPLLGKFNITNDVFTEYHTDPMYFKKSKEEIPDTKRSVVRLIDGEYCKVCKDFYSMAVSNQSDGTLVCWSCRDSNRWMFLCG